MYIVLTIYDQDEKKWKSIPFRRNAITVIQNEKGEAEIITENGTSYLCQESFKYINDMIN